MKNLTKPLTILLCLLSAAAVSAQSFMLRPYYGYYSPRLTDVNNQISDQMEGWQQVLGDPLRSPEKFGGRALFGGQVQYHLNDDYFLALDVYRYEQSVATENTRTTGAIPYRFLFTRSVESLAFVLNLNYYFGYDPGARLNKYVGLGPGLIIAEAHSNTQLVLLNDAGGKDLQPVDTQGDFSKTAFSLTLLGGLDFRLFGAVSLWGEAGYQYAKIGQFEGTVRRAGDQQNVAFTTNTSFDFSGFYFRAGLGVGSPF